MAETGGGRCGRLVRALVLSVMPLSLSTLVGCGEDVTAQEESSQGRRPLPVRNDVARQRGEEFLVLRHQQLRKGTHQKFYEISRDGVWPWFEKIGTRVVGQWQVIHPEGGGPDDHDEGYRLARYASYEHWKDTRTGVTMGGNGPDSEKSREALRARNEFRLGSSRVYFLQGHMAPGGPYYLPGLDERYEQVKEARAGEPPRGEPFPVRNDIARRGREVVALRYWKIKKGGFSRFNEASIEGVWPYFEKIGARIIGQWKVVYPEEGKPEESPDFDEVVMLTRYAGHEHWKATRRAVELGGNGRDHDRLRDALRLRRSLTIETSVEFLQGYMYHSPPIFMPGLEERYRLSDQETERD